MTTIAVLLSPTFSTSSLATQLSLRKSVSQSSPQSTWSLSQTAYRSTPSQPTNNAQTESGLLQILRLSSTPSQTFVHITVPNEKPTSIVVPSGQDANAFTTLMSSKMGLMWQPVKQLSFEVSGGKSWTVDGFELLVGEITGQSAGTATSNSGSRTTRGSIVVVKYGGGTQAMDEGKEGDGDGKESSDQALIRKFLEELSISTAKIGEQVLDEYWSLSDAWEDHVVLWCQALRHKGLSGFVRRTATKK